MKTLYYVSCGLHDGFTLLEVLLSVSVLAMMAGLSLPLYNSFVSGNDVANSTTTVTSMLRRAESYVRANKGDAQWGVNFQSSAVTLFQGGSFATRNSGLDEVFNPPSDVTLSFSGDVVFAKLSGAPAAGQNIVISDINSRYSRTVTVNSKGMVAD